MTRPAWQEQEKIIDLTFEARAFWFGESAIPKSELEILRKKILREKNIDIAFNCATLLLLSL